jgi:hypothetical protein
VHLAFSLEISLHDAKSPGSGLSVGWMTSMTPPTLLNVRCAGSAQSAV